MALELTSGDVRYVARELAIFIGAKVEKIFQSDKEKRDVLFQFFCADGGKRNLRFVPGFVCMPKAKPEYPQQPPGFAMFLRKHLAGTRIVSIEQAGFDRILRIGFERKRAESLERLTLVIEFLPPGNMILVDAAGRILNLLENQQFKDRTLRARQEYIPPPPVFDLPAKDDEELARHITASTRDSIVTTLAIHCGLGGIYAEEACIRADIPKHRSDLKQEEVMRIVRALRETLDAPIAACKDDRRAYPFLLKSRPTQPCEETSFLAALCASADDEALGERPAATRQRERASPKSKLNVMLEAQQGQITRLEEEAAVEHRKGEIIFEQYAVVQEVLQAVHEARAKKQDIQEALKRFPQVISYNKDTGILEFELELEASR